jgi:hypothetical protein
LGPVIVDRKEYLSQAFLHLQNGNNYSRLHKTQALYCLQFTHADIDNFIKQYSDILSKDDTKYLTAMHKKFNSSTNNLARRAKFISCLSYIKRHSLCIPTLQSLAPYWKV